MSSCIISGYLKTLFVVVFVVTSRQVSGSCPPNNYFDYHTEQCHPCSECDYPRTPNQFCLKDCPGHRCEAGKYFDEHTQNCHLCTECKPPRTPNEFCQAQCTVDERNGMSTSASVHLVAQAASVPPTGLTVDNIIIVVLCTVMGTVVLVLVILGVLYWRQCLCKDKCLSRSPVPEHEQHRQPFLKRGPSNGQNSVDIEMQSLPAPRSDEAQQTLHHDLSLPILSCQRNSSNTCANNNLRHREDSVALVDDRERTSSVLDSETSSPLHLVETSTRLQNSLSQDRSIKGNVVCQPENEEPLRCQLLPSVCQGNTDAVEVHGLLSPSSTRDAERPHLSFDPNKDCGYEDHVFPNSSSMNNGFDIQTSLKSSC